LHAGGHRFDPVHLHHAKRVASLCESGGKPLVIGRQAVGERVIGFERNFWLVYCLEFSGLEQLSVVILRALSGLF
jgi:hypothetical protein